MFDIFNIFSLKRWMLFCYLPKNHHVIPGSLRCWTWTLEALRGYRSTGGTSCWSGSPPAIHTGFGDTSQVFLNRRVFGAWRLWLRTIPKILTSEKRTSWKIECFCGFQVLSKHVSESTNQQEWSHFPMWAVSKILGCFVEKHGKPNTFITRVSPFWMISGASENPNLYESGVPRFLTALRRSKSETDSLEDVFTVWWIISSYAYNSIPKNGSFNLKIKVSENDPNRSRWVA